MFNQIHVHFEVNTCTLYYDSQPHLYHGVLAWGYESTKHFKVKKKITESHLFCKVYCTHGVTLQKLLSS